jgi:hypothetical protein
MAARRKTDMGFWDDKIAAINRAEFEAEMQRSEAEINSEFAKAADIRSMTPAKFSDMQDQPVWVRRANGNHAASDMHDFLAGA